MTAKGKERERRYSNSRDRIECPAWTLVALRAEKSEERDTHTKMEIMEQVEITTINRLKAENANRRPKMLEQRVRKHER